MTRPHPDLWYPIAALLSALRKLLSAANPYAFADIAGEARAQLAVLTALIRRYIHILAADIIVPPPRATAPRPDPPAAEARRLARRFGTLTVPGLRDLPVPWHITRRAGPFVDTLLMRLDQRARPQAWAGLDTS